MIKWLIFILAVGGIAHGDNILAHSQFKPKDKINCTAVGDGNYVYGCSKMFYMCSNGNLYTQNCHSELFFDPVTNACERAENIELCTTQNLISINGTVRATEAFNCKGKVDTAYELAPCLNRFAHCKSGNIFYEGCPTGTVYDDSKKYCDWPDKVAGCQEKRSTSSRPPRNGEGAAAAPGYGPQDEAPQSIINHQSSYGRQFKRPPVANSQQNDTLLYNFPKITPLEHPQDTSIQQQQPAEPPRTDFQQKRQPIIQRAQELSHQPLQQQPVFPKPSSNGHEFDCNGKADGHYPTPLNACATFFFKCYRNQTYKYNCPYGLYFSAQMVHCDLLSRVPECNGKALPYPNGPLIANSQIHTRLPVQPPPQSYLPSQQQSMGVVSAKPALKVDFDCRDKADGFYPIGKCQNDYIRCIHKTPYLQECPENFVFENDICEYINECLKTIPPQQNPPQQPQQPVAPASPTETYTLKQAQQRAINQIQETYLPRTSDSGSNNQHAAPPKSSSYDEQPLYSQEQRIQNDQQNEAKSQPSGTYPQPNTQPAATQSQQSPPLPQVKDTYCQDKGLVHGSYSSGCSNYYFACYPHETIRVPCPANLFYDSESDKCDYKENVPVCGGTRPTSPSAQQQPQSYPTYAQNNAPAQVPPIEQQQKYSTFNNQQAQQPQAVQQNQPTYNQQHASSDSQGFTIPQPQQDVIYQSATLHSENLVQHSYQPLSQQPVAQNYVHQQQPATAATPAPAWIPYPQPNHQIETQMLPQQQPLNPAPAWVPYPEAPQQSVQQKHPAQQPAVYHQSQQQSNQQLVHQSVAPQPQAQSSNSQNSYGQQSVKHSLPIETFCRDNNRRDGFNGAGCAPYFFICALGETTRLHCPTGLYYDEEIHECGQKTTIAACGGQQLSTSAPAQQQPVISEFDCRQDGVYVSGCSSTYHICNQQKSRTLYCPPGTYYSILTEHCDYKAHIVECGGTALTTAPSSQHPVLIPQKPSSHQTLGQQQQPFVSNYKIQFISKMSNAQGQSAQKRPFGIDYPAPLQERVRQQTPAAPATPASPSIVEDDKCMKLSNGIYGTKCTKFFFVCIEKKSFDFMCPKDQAFNLATVKCAPKSENPACPEYVTASQRPPSQQLYNQQQQPQQFVAPSSHAQTLTQQTYSPTQQITNSQQQNSVSNQLNTKYVQNQPVQQQQQPTVAATPAPAWIPYSGQQPVHQTTTQNIQMLPQQQPLNPAPAWVPYSEAPQQQSLQQNHPAQQSTVSQIQVEYRPHSQQTNQQFAQQPAANTASSQVSYSSQQLQHQAPLETHSQPQQSYNIKAPVQHAAQQPGVAAPPSQQSYFAQQPTISQSNTAQHISSHQSYSHQSVQQQTPPQQPSVAQQYQSLPAQHNTLASQQSY